MREDFDTQTELSTSLLIWNHTTPAFNSRQEICWFLERDKEMSHAGLKGAGSQLSCKTQKGYCSVGVENS
jgi:hypothetical protein